MVRMVFTIWEAFTMSVRLRRRTWRHSFEVFTQNHFAGTISHRTKSSGKEKENQRCYCGTYGRLLERFFILKSSNSTGGMQSLKLTVNSKPCETIMTAATELQKNKSRHCLKSLHSYYKLLRKSNRRLLNISSIILARSKDRQPIPSRASYQRVFV